MLIEAPGSATAASDSHLESALLIVESQKIQKNTKNSSLSALLFANCFLYFLQKTVVCLLFLLSNHKKVRFGPTMCAVHKAILEIRVFLFFAKYSDRREEFFRAPKKQNMSGTDRR